MADRVGAHSQLAQLVAAVVVAASCCFSPDRSSTCRGAVLASIVVHHRDRAHRREGWRHPPRKSRRFTLALVTAAAVAFAGLEQGILLAVGLSLLRHCGTAIDRIRRAAPDEQGRWLPTRSRRACNPSGARRVSLRADLFYANETRSSTK